jgi:hypothetical protein
VESSAFFAALQRRQTELNDRERRNLTSPNSESQAANRIQPSQEDQTGKSDAKPQQ